MSTYAVFGMTRHRAREMAKKRTKIVRKVNGVFEQIPESEWLAKVDEETNKIMAGSQVAQLSDRFDSPDIARQFFDIARRADSRDLRIKAQNRTGAIKKGRLQTEWIDIDVQTGQPA